DRDKERIVQRFNVTLPVVRSAAEESAFCMAAVAGLSLEPTRAALLNSLAASSPPWLPQAEAALDALEYTKLARAVEGCGGARGLTFAHRRIQEYFATCVILRRTDRVPIRQLLTDQNWREASVTILQTHDADGVRPLIDNASSLVTELSDDNADDGFQWPPG